MQMFLLIATSFTTRIRKFILKSLKLLSSHNLVVSLFTPLGLESQAKLAPTMRNKWAGDWDGNWFYCRVPEEQTTDAWGKGNYLLSSTMTPLNYLMEAPSACGLDNTNVAAFVEATSIIRGRDAVEEFLSCGLWPLSEKFGFKVETMESTLSKVVVPMSRVTTIIGA
jgi:hypothetical protein